MRDAGAGLGEAGDLGRGQVDAVRAPDVVGEPAEPVEVLDGRAAVELAAVSLLLDRLREMRVEREAEAPRERRGLLHQPARDGERRAGRDGDLDPRAWAGLVELRVEALGVGEIASSSSTRSSGGRPPSEMPRSIEPRDATMRTPSSRAACTSASTMPSRPRGKT